MGGLIGLECETTQEVCPNGCSGNGVCNLESHTCSCNPGWNGADCSLQTCTGPPLNDCNDHGLCQNGTCKCHEGYEGVACAIIAGLEEGCKKTCLSQCLQVCSQVYKAKGLAASKQCYLSCNHKCLNNCIATDTATSHSDALAAAALMAHS